MRITLDRATIDAVMLNLASGARYDDVAGIVGVTPRTLYRWRAKGEELVARIDAEETTEDELTEDERLCLELVEGVSRARSTVVVDAMANIRRAFSTNWRAAAWYLERTDPEHYGRIFRERPGKDEPEETEEPTEEDKAAIVSAAINFAERRAAKEAKKTG